jgi:signal transduction histidine kinase
MKRKFSIGNKLYLSVVSLFLLFAIAFIVFQQHRERQYKIETLTLRLQDCNNQLHDALLFNRDQAMGQFLNNYLRKGSFINLRVTIISKKGKVLFDTSKDYRTMSDHSHRPEVEQALKEGMGFSVDRNSHTLKKDYFYCATYYPQNNIIIRSALPYDVDLAKNLKSDQHYIWFALIVIVLLTLVLYNFTHRIGTNITRLNQFATRASSPGFTSAAFDQEWGKTLGTFSNDELGDTAERIVKLYIRLKKTQQEQSVLKRQLTQNVAHELKTPVASIQGYLETILENPRIDDKTRDLFLQRCYAQSKRLAALLNDMSTLNRLDDGADMMVFEEVDVAEIIRTVERESQFNLEQKGMSMRCEIPNEILINGNSGLLYSTFRNLTDNAIAYAGANTHILLTAERKDDGFWHFMFKDDGVGVAPEHLPRLFERFYRVDKGRSRKMGGTGLGLAIVKNAVRVHGGSISVKNNPEGGLRFDFTLKA